MAAERILIVDDDESIRQIVGMCLTDEGYEVFEAPNGQVALERLAEAQPDLILLDLRMPVMDGGSSRAATRSCPGRTRPSSPSSPR